MIKLNLQLFGGEEGNPEDTTNAAGLITADPGQSIMIGKRVNSDNPAGYYFDSRFWDQIYGKANASAKNNSDAYLQGLGLSLSKDGKKINNISDTYSNTFHLIKAESDDEKEMYYVMHIGADGSVRISEPGHSSQILNKINSDYVEGSITADPKGYYRNAEVINGSIDWQGKSKLLGTDAEGNKVFNDGNGGVITSTGGIVTSYTDKNGKLVTGVVGADGTISRWTDDSGKDVIIPAVTSSGTPVQTAYNMYYNDLYSREKGTLGRDILDNNISLYEKEAQNAGILADTSVQSQAMAQAQGIKQVTDALRSERMAQLRAGMSESQLADRELSMLMSSVNQFSGQAQAANQDALTAQLGASTARENAFNDYIAQTTALGQNASANYASQVGDLIKQAQIYQAEQAAQGVNISLGSSLDKILAK